MALKLHRSVCFIEQVLIRLCILQVYHRKHLSVERLITLAFFQGFFFGGGGSKIYYYANFYCYANFSIAFRPNWGKVSEGRETVWGAPLAPMEESQSPCINYIKYPWGDQLYIPMMHSAVDMGKITSTHEGKTNWFSIQQSPSRVLMMCLMGTDDMPHGYWLYASRVLMICLMGTDYMPHGYWWYASQVLMICLTGTDDMPHGYWWYASRVLMTSQGLQLKFCLYDFNCFIQIPLILDNYK